MGYPPLSLISYNQKKIAMNSPSKAIKKAPLLGGAFDAVLRKWAQKLYVHVALCMVR